uniref:trypsin n=1 Tax=Bombyx mandarina TaxID=7092 RepID=A7UNZ4_BOMMA|nr:cocoonase [Bombyx mandarina]
MEKLYLFIVFLSCALLLKDVTCTDSEALSKDEEKIVGGEEISINKVPYQAYLLLQKGNEYFQCGGSIISKRHILTAAHCIEGISKVTVRIGSSNSNKGGTVYTAKSKVAHPKYNSKTKNNDFAIVTVNKDMAIDGKTTKIITLAKEGSSVPDKTKLLVSGWGATSEGGSSSTTLRAVHVQAHSDDECKKYFRSLTSNMFCAGPPEGGKDSCQGDSGGPAVKGNVQLGVVSFGVGCARKNNPGIYAKVSAAAKWIKSTAGL